LRLPRFYPILDSALLEAHGLPLADAARALLDGGARWIQLRHKGHFTRKMFECAESIAALARGAGATFIINDRADIALLVDAGLHVGQDDLPPADARRLIGPGRVLGFSTHNEEQLLAAAAEPVDYAAIGPIFVTSSKGNPDPVVGVEGLRRLRSLTTKPVVAIGGITLESAPAVIAAGADSIAVIGALYAGAPDCETIRKRAAQWGAVLGA
jgi:thiamine-phosphate pyrophosphorylase